MSGAFASCDFCRLSPEDLQTLRVFLRSRGNLREVQTHLGVSYPTARARFAQLLQRLGLADQPPDRDEVLADLAAGTITVAEAERLLRGNE